MGSWGASLYENDLTCDIRDDYLDLLRQGKSPEEASSHLISANQDILSDPEEAALFWLALADTQWEYGRLQPDVLNMALFYLDKPLTAMSIWENAEHEEQQKRVTMLGSLRQKLLSPLPPVKSVPSHSGFKCPWKLGDVFLYRLHGKESETSGLFGKYISFRKVAEAQWYPHSIVPVVHFYNWLGDTIPDLGTLSQVCFLPSIFPKGVTKRGKLFFDILIVADSLQQLPSQDLIYLGNIAGSDLDSSYRYTLDGSICYVGWEKSSVYPKIESFIIERLSAWSSVEKEIK